METTRRDFLKTGAVIGGSLIVGAKIAYANERGPAAADDKPFGAWIQITPSNEVYFYLDKAEMGQGVISSLTALVGEELGVHPNKIRVQFAPVGSEYGNPAMFGAQMTGGSSSLRTTWKPLREAGAAAGWMIKRAFAKQTLGENFRDRAFREEEYELRDLQVINKKTGAKASFGQLATAAAALEIPSHVKLKDPKDFIFVGKSIPRYDATMKVTGKAKFGIDTDPEVTKSEMLNCVIVRCPVIGGTLSSFSAEDEKPEIKYIKLKNGVAVVAPTYWQALQASKKVKAKWNFGKNANLNSEDLTAEYNRLAKQSAAYVSGDKVSNMNAGQIEAFYEVPFVPHATMEPMNCTTWIRDGQCDVWVSTQAPAAGRELAAQVTGLPPSKINVHSTLIGGGFGRRIYQDFVAESVSVAKNFDKPVKLTWTREDDFKNDYYRPMMVHRIKGSVGKDGMIDFWLHRTVGQSILSYVIDVFLRSLNIIPSSSVDFLTKMLGGFYTPKFFKTKFRTDPFAIEGVVTNIPDLPYRQMIPYAIDNFRVEFAHIDPKVPVGFWRSVGHSHTAFAIESFMDELADSVKADPYQFRMKHLDKMIQKNNFITRPLARLIDTPILHRKKILLQKLEQISGWSNRTSKAGVGYGMALHEAFGTMCGMVIEVLVKENKLKVSRVFCVVDCGFVVNPDIVKAQVEGSVIFGLTAALKQEITFKDGQVQQNNFYDSDLLRYNECPEMTVDYIRNNEAPSGIGEPAVPPVAPALCNAIFAATGKRIRKLPIAKAGIFTGDFA
ncbi:MAG: molybdopterin cofactor-binding domain-containing protein [Pseudobdellovibrionaceae bacterium]